MVPFYLKVVSFLCLNMGMPKTINFPFGTNGKLTVLGVSVFRHMVLEYILLQMVLEQ